MKNFSSCPGAVIPFATVKVGSDEWSYSCGMCQTTFTGFSTEYATHEFRLKHDRPCEQQFIQRLVKPKRKH